MITKAIILNPVLTEKATELSAKNVYMFQVAKTAKKTQIAESIEALYNVKVASVRVTNRVGKIRRVGRMSKMVQLPDTRRAYVTLVSGKIDVFPKA